MFNPMDVHSRRLPQSSERRKLTGSEAPGSDECLAFEKPTRSVPEIWGRMHDVLALIN
jgi:hypothetical protein